MTWQLSVLIGAAVGGGVIAVFVLKLRHARQVFDRIVGQVEETRNDEVGRHRRAHGRLLRDLGDPGIAAHARRHS